MDFGKNVALKENYTFFVANADGQVGPPAGDGREGATAAESEWGLYHRDTRYLSRYLWRFLPDLQTLLLHSPTPGELKSHHSLLGHHQQFLALERDLSIGSAALVDRIAVETIGERRELSLELHFAADFADLFEVRGWGTNERRVTSELDGDGVRFSYEAADGPTFSTRLDFSRTPDSLDEGRARFHLILEPGERWELDVRVQLDSQLQDGQSQPRDGLSGPTYPDWRQEFRGLPVATENREVTRQAIDDLRALLLFTEEGPVPAAGIPWYVAAFGRDALLTAAMLLPWAPEVAEGTLRYLARHQGRRLDPYRAEAPGKIMHELRFGELARTGRIPHSPYYGTVDATPLYLVLLGRFYRETGNLELVRELRPSWEAALGWMEAHGDGDGDGFLEFTPAEPGKGLNVQSWKDSEDSMSHRGGSLAPGSLAVAEVQGYAFEAFEAAAAFYRDLGEEAASEHWRERAERMRVAFHQAFWLEELGTYAMALDGAKRPLAVQNSDAGHLLWSGLVPREQAPRLVATLFSPENWSGWGFRTLGRDEARYNPVSYHNGSVWPHDTAMIAGGLVRYGFTEEASRVGAAIFDLARSQPDKRLPELIAGYGRTEDSPPVPYPVACRPQAWDAAALVYLATLLGK